LLHDAAVEFEYLGVYLSSPVVKTTWSPETRLQRKLLPAFAMSAIHSFGFDEALVQRALAKASGDEELAINLILNDQVDDAAPPAARAAETAPPPPIIRQSSLFNLPSHPESQRFFVVKNCEVETSNKADAFVHGVENEWQTHACNGAQFPNGSDMWLGKIELGESNVFYCFTH
jgi:hypothetical protein